MVTVRKLAHSWKFTETSIGLLLNFTISIQHVNAVQVSWLWQDISDGKSGSINAADEQSDKNAKKIKKKKSRRLQLKYPGQNYSYKLIEPLLY